MRAGQRDDGGITIPGTADLPSMGGAALFDHLADGVMVTGADNRIAWVNEPFIVMYGFGSRSAALGATFEDAYRTAWQDLAVAECALFERGLARGVSVAVTGQVEKDDTMFFREMRHLGTPVAGVATPAVDKHKRRFSGAIDLIRNRGAVFGRDNLGPWGLCVSISNGKKQQHQATGQGQP